LNCIIYGREYASFVALVTILETFTNLDKGEGVEHQIYRNIPKLVPFDAHGRPVTKERLEAIYDTRSTIAHGSYGQDGHGNLTWGVTHIDAKFANVDIHLSSEVLSIAVKLLRRVLFDPKILSVFENAKTGKQKRRAIRGYVNPLPDASSDSMPAAKVAPGA
jgi:Apea-like HEPN